MCNKKWKQLEVNQSMEWYHWQDVDGNHIWTPMFQVNQGLTLDLIQFNHRCRSPASNSPQMIMDREGINSDGQLSCVDICKVLTPTVISKK